MADINIRYVIDEILDQLTDDDLDVLSFKLEERREAREEEEREREAQLVEQRREEALYEEKWKDVKKRRWSLKCRLNERCPSCGKYLTQKMKETMCHNCAASKDTMDEIRRKRLEEFDLRYKVLD